MGKILYVTEDGIKMNAPQASVLVNSESDLADLTGENFIGAFAYTAGFATVWQCDTDGETWVEVE